MDEIKVMTEEAHRGDKRVMTHCISAEGAKNSLIGGVDTIEHGYLLDDEAIDMISLVMKEGRVEVNRVHFSSTLISKRTEPVPAFGPQI